MLSAIESSLIIAGSILAALLLLRISRRFWLPKTRHQHNDVIGWQISFLSTTYAVIIAFMLSDVWTNYQNAETNTEVEANSLLNIFRVAEGLPEPQRVQVPQLAMRYAETMIQEEWPAMTHGTFSKNGFRNTSDLWKAIMSTRAQTGSEQASFEHALSDLTNMTEHRRIRHLQSRSKLPGIFWLVLIVGGVMTVAYTCLFDIEATRMHVVQVVGVTFVISLVLVTIADIDGPYGGAVRIQPTAFEMALQTMMRSAQ